MKKGYLPVISKRLIESAAVIGLTVMMISTSKETQVEIAPVVVKEPEVKQVHYLSDEELSELYTLREQPINDTCMSFLIEESNLIMETARAEGGDTLEGQLWVMGVIVNRVKSGLFPNSIFGVISAPKQFEVYYTGRYKKVELNANSHLALAEIEKGNNPTQGALYFEASTNSSKSWHSQNKEFIAEVQGQKYYK